MNDVLKLLDQTVRYIHATGFTDSAHVRYDGRGIHDEARYVSIPFEECPDPVCSEARTLLAAPSPALTREALAQALVAETDSGGPPAVWDLLDERGRDYFRGRADSILRHLAALSKIPPPTEEDRARSLRSWCCSWAAPIPARRCAKDRLSRSSAATSAT